MISLTIVRTGTLYGPEYVDRLIAGVKRNLKVDHVTLLTDQEYRHDAGRPVVSVIDISAFKLPGWWAKMLLFSPQFRGPGRSLYLDLDTVEVGDLKPMFTHTPSSAFMICGSFTRQFGNQSWPCKYGSCAMTFPESWGQHIWLQFQARRAELMKLPRGDQQAIEALIPDAGLFQSFLNPRFFLNYRELKDYPAGPPPETGLVVFGGHNKPHNCQVPWVRAAWERA